MENLGALYRNGQGMDQDYDKAGEWSAKAEFQNERIRRRSTGKGDSGRHSSGCSNTNAGLKSSSKVAPSWSP
jgi:TPR repeat protein